MNVSPDKLLKHLGSAQCLDGKWRCPLHSDGDMCLSASPGPEVVFSCAHPVCRFRGDAAALVSLARDIPLSEAVGLFAEGGELEDCMLKPLLASDVEAYFEEADAQTVLKAYLARCVRALRRQPEKAGVRTGMSLNNLRLLHPEVGLFLDSGVPRCLRELTKPKYRKSTFILYPFTMSGEVTRIEVLDPANPSFRYMAVVTHPDTGVFGEASADIGERVLAVERPEVAAKLWAVHGSGSTRRPPIVAFHGYPLPEAFRNTTRIDLLSTADAPVSTEFLLETLSAPEIKAGRAPEIRAVDWRSSVDSLRYDDISDFKATKARYNDLQYMVAKRFASMVSDGKGAEVLSVLDSVQVPMVVRNLIKSTAETQLAIRGGFGGNSEPAEKLTELLGSSDCGEPSNVALANGRTLHCGPDGVFAVKMNGVREPMANVGLSVDSRRMSGDDEMFECTVTARGGFPAVSVRMAWKDLVADRMRSVVQKAYSELGLSPYVAFYTVAGFAWRDVVSKLAENCRVEKSEPVELGKPVKCGSLKLKPIKEGE